MMGALVNGRRGGRSQSLLMAALITCVLLLGFKNWVSHSRNVELQMKLLELEERVKQTSAEREREQVGRSEAEKQLTFLEDNHQRQQRSVQSKWNQEKGNLLLNISSSAKMVAEMKTQMKSLLEDFNKVQKDLQSCKNNMNTLNKKLTYDMTQCNTQMLAQREECSEKIAAAKQEVQKKYEKQTSLAADPEALVSTQKAIAARPVPGGISRNASDKSAVHLLSKELAPEIKLSTDDHLKSSEKSVEKDSVKPSIFKPSNKNTTLERVMDFKGGDFKDTDVDLDTAVAGEVNDDEDAIEYDNEGEIEKRLSKPKDNKAVQEFEEDLADYNGDDENEPEFEADKQAELAEA